MINTGIGRMTSMPDFEGKVLPEIVKDFASITGQKPATCLARRSIAGFKIRQGMVIGLKSTLRKKMMASFLSKLVMVVLPRVRDFRGISLQNVDENGNLTIGVKEHIVFPEINPEHAKVSFGIQATLVPRDITDRKKAIELYQSLGVPFSKQQTTNKK